MTETVYEPHLRLNYRHYPPYHRRDIDNLRDGYYSALHIRDRRNLIDDVLPALHK